MKCVVSLFLVFAIGTSVLGQESEETQVAQRSQPPIVDYLAQVYGDALPPEGARMLMAIASGSKMGPGEGWFGPAETRYTWQWLTENGSLDSNSSQIAQDKFLGKAEEFRALDRNRDGIIQQFDLDWNDSNPYVQMSYNLNRVFRMIDQKGEGQLTREQWMKFFDDATEGKDLLLPDDFSAQLLSGFSFSFPAGSDSPDEATLIRGLFAGEIGSIHEGPKVGQRAPLFRLKKVEGEGEIDLGSLIGEKPVVLVTGNFTCGPFRAFYPAVDSLYKEYESRANFLMVYVREAHPTDGWQMQSNERAGVSIAQPQTYEERAGVAGQFCTRLHPNIPVVVDELSDPVGHAYSGMPARLYVIDREGRIAYKSGRGPFGFKPGEMEQALVMCLLDQSLSAPPEKEATTMVPSDEQTWESLPEVVSGERGPLPNWAKVVARHLPRTAAAMLQLDHAQRTKSPLDPKLRAKMRWVVANSNRCDYSQATALADLKTAGADLPEITTLTGDAAAWPDAEREALQFARELTLSAPTIEDALFQSLRQKYGDKQVAAMVLLAAYGNFQDRIVLGLATPLEANGPLPPLDIQFNPIALQMAPILPESSEPQQLLEGGEDVIASDGDWTSISYDELQSRLKRQQERVQRLPTPTWEEVAKQLPPEFNARPTRIVWNLVCMGYVPELAIRWSTTTRTMWAEAHQDRVFEESLFWIQTRSIECNYCMGHCEMLLQVAGLSENDIADRVRKLASDDWSAFPPEQQRAFDYARRLSKTPWEVTVADYQQLEKDLGEKNAMATFFWLCRGLYMTRVSDGFQLALERENVFGNVPPPTTTNE